MAGMREDSEFASIRPKKKPRASEWVDLNPNSSTSPDVKPKTRPHAPSRKPSIRRLGPDFEGQLLQPNPKQHIHGIFSSVCLGQSPPEAQTGQMYTQGGGVELVGL